MKKIAIIGATGMIGQPVTYEFIDAGYIVSVFARDAQRAKRIFGPLVEIVEGDLKNRNQIKDFLKGHDFLYINLSVDPDSKESDFQPERDGLRNILKAAKKSEITRIGYLSSLMHKDDFTADMDWWVSDIKKNAIYEIRAAYPSFTIFYPSVFMESFHKGFYRQADRIKIVGKSKIKRHYISGSDYGKQVIKAFEIDNGNNHYVIQGPEALTVSDAVTIFASNYTKEHLKITPISFSLLKFFGKFNKRNNYTTNIMWTLNHFPEKFEAEKTWEKLGKPKMTVKSYSNAI